ncbi:uncharacterized protein IL334_000260 [Kwoniella shivajii]|uniref:Extracellular membrane protein CFEM domain-containing protein n=1 Tax=Kwoniella shivajii TaxID=564305 RepID=A0ABZ1CNN2_9TREE|nr:hypothetical protein IL334_000260 [Kwoniella shivajii]
MSSPETYWSCPDLPANSTDSLCCFVNSTCANYVCDSFGSTQTNVTSNGSTFHNCMVRNGTLATDMIKNQTENNGSCSSQTWGNGCIVRTALSDNDSTSTSNTNTTSSGSSGSSDASREFMVINQSILLGIVGVSWLIKKFL